MGEGAGKAESGEELLKELWHHPIAGGGMPGQSQGGVPFPVWDQVRGKDFRRRRKSALYFPCLLSYLLTPRRNKIPLIKKINYALR